MCLVHIRFGKGWKAIDGYAKSSECCNYCMRIGHPFLQLLPNQSLRSLPLLKICSLSCQLLPMLLQTLLQIAKAIAQSWALTD